MKREQLVVVGAGGFGREVADVVEAINAAGEFPEWNLVGVFDDAPTAVNLERLRARGLRHLGSIDDLIKAEARPRYVVGIGDPNVRKSIVARLDAAGLVPGTLVHPHASIGSQCVIGQGSVLLAGVRITTNVRVGSHVHLNPNVTVGHDTILEDFVSVNPQAAISGDCIVEVGALVGVGGIILNQIRVGAGARVGGGACVVKEVGDGVTVKGVPAR